MKTTLLALAILCFVPPTLAANWYFITPGATNTSVRFFDADTVQNKDGQVTFWMKVINDKTDPKMNEYSSLGKMTFNCRKREFLVHKSSDYDLAGNVTWTHPEEASTEVPPGTVAEFLLKVACTSNFPNTPTPDGSLYWKIKGNRIDEMAADYFLGLKKAMK